MREKKEKEKEKNNANKMLTSWVRFNKKIFVFLADGGGQSFSRENKDRKRCVIREMRRKRNERGKKRRIREK